MTVKELKETLNQFKDDEKVTCVSEMMSHYTTYWCMDSDFGIFRNKDGELILEVSGDVEDED
jgi:hypothetical protein